MKRIAVIGACGFVGSAFCRELDRRGLSHIPIGRGDFHKEAGREWDLVINAAGNSVKFMADHDPISDFEQNATHALQVCLRYKATTLLHISSVDVYADLTSQEATTENSSAGVGASHYGCHKWIAEELVRHHAPQWMIIRLAGMVGPGLRKNPVFDILNGHPLRISPDSRYQFMETDAVARCALNLLEQEKTGEIFNLCGQGLISPREIAVLAEKELIMTEEARGLVPRIVDINTEKILRHTPLPSTRDALIGFLQASSPRTE